MKLNNCFCICVLKNKNKIMKIKEIRNEIKFGFLV